MRKLFWLIIPLTMTMSSCNEKKVDTNPFFVEWTTPFGVPPFDQITEDHYLPAYEEAMKLNNAEIDAIINNSEVPTFENTILAYDQAGKMLNKIGAVFGGLRSSNTNDKMQEISKTVTPKLTAHYNEIGMNQMLFSRIKAVYEKRNDLNLDIEQMRLVEKMYQDFQRNGADLPEEKRNELKSLSERMAMLSLTLGQNLLSENNGFKLVLDKNEDLAGLPADIISAAATKAKENGMEGKWVFDLSKPSWIPFLQFSERRDLREKLFRAYFMRGDNDNETDNKKPLVELVSLRQKQAKLLGFNNYSQYVTDVQMAKTPENVINFLTEVWTPAIEIAKKERNDMQAIIDRNGEKFKLESWDWWFYAEKVRQERYNMNEDEMKPYFTIENAKQGCFYLAEQLYGLKFVKKSEIPVYHPEVEAYEVQEKDGSHLAVLLIDPHPRQGAKNGGAWCGTYRSGSWENGNRIAPIVTMVMNFTRPVGDKPAMLSWDETTTYFHEFGHALHNFFAQGKYRRTSRSVPRDFVELPSQVCENWAGEPEVLKVYAKHYETGESIPDVLIEKLQKSEHFNQGFVTTEYTASAILDIAWHTSEITEDTDARAFENAELSRIGLINEIVPRYRSTNFGHIFSGGYASGYYVYLWAGVLDADAFAAFKESGDLFNPELAAKFRKHILAENGMGEGMEQYLKFRGKEPSIEALLKQRGLK
ncbi:MAG: M3 family metallopeptidase [Salinivirgaceae bacterium]|nr:M3 family metallopeptidase [Salinivirgaceae bacterium]